MVVAVIAGHLNEATFIIAFVIGAFTMALSIVVVLIGIPRQQFWVGTSDVPLTLED